MPEDLPLEPGKTYGMWVYNPYPKSIPVSKLRFGIAYLDAYKRLNEVRPLDPEVPEGRELSPGDTLHMDFTMPAPKSKPPVFARAVISENNLYWGINGSAQRINP